MAASKFASKTKKKKAARRSYDFPKFWSYSRWEVANKCLARYEYQFLQKLPQPEAPPLVRGIRVHNEGESYLDNGGRVPKSYNQFADEMRAIRKMGAKAEAGYAFTKSWQQTSAQDWANCWLRIKIDAEVVDGDGGVTLVDFKTGKPWPKATEEQSSLYAVGAFQLHPDVDQVDAEFWYLDSGEVVPYVYTRSQFPNLKKKWAGRGRELIATRQFPATNNSYNCKYCPFRTDKKLGNGQPGPCDAWRKAK